MVDDEEQKQARLKAFEDLRAVSEALEPYFKERIAQRAAAAASLEARFAERGLRFTRPFGGDYPVQAFGHIDGMRFYFRYRWGWASLKVGPYDREIEELHALRAHESLLEHLAEDRSRFEAGKIDEQTLLFSEIMAEKRESIAEEDDLQFFPHRTAKHASLQDPALDGLKGDLTAEEAEDFFSQLVENLTELPEDQQLSEYDRILYYEGWPAAKAWYAQRE